MTNRHPNDLVELMQEATMALLRRDPERLADLERISAGWLQTGREADAQRYLLQAMAEAAEFLLDHPTEMPIEDEDEDGDPLGAWHGRNE